MKNQLLIVFAKNILLGKVKTRLAKTVGDEAAFEVYKHLVEITENETKKLINCDVHIYFSDVIIESKWPSCEKFVQEGVDLGERMLNAFKNGFNLGYSSVIGIGTDLPDLNAKIMQEAFDKLQNHATVFGPAEDGGYYLIGMNKLYPEIFQKKPWSTDQLLDLTLDELSCNNVSFTTLEMLNDIDTIEDLSNASIASKFKHLIP